MHEELEKDKNVIKYKIKQLEYLVANSIIKEALSAQFSFNSIETKEEYAAHLYFVAFNYDEDYIAVVNGDMVKNDYKDGWFEPPVYKVKPTKIDDYIEDGYLSYCPYDKNFLKHLLFHRG